MSLQHEKSSTESNIHQQLTEKINTIKQLQNELELKSSQVTSQAEKITQATSESSMLKMKCETQERELNNFRCKLNESQMNSSTHLTSITAQLVDREDQLNKCQDESSRRLIAIEQLERELMNLQTRHDSAIKEIGRLESKLQSHQLDFVNDNKMLESEVSVDLVID